MNSAVRHAHRFCMAACLSFAAMGALAHGGDESSLLLRVSGSGVAVEWRIALRDLEHAIGLDANRDGLITWGELRSRHDAIAGYALRRFVIRAGGSACPSGPVWHGVDKHRDGAYAVLRFTAACAANVEALEISYKLLFDVDRQHRGIMRLHHRGRSATAVFDPDRTVRRFDLAGGQILSEH